MRTLLEEAISEYFGERCPDFEPGCPCCRAWAEFDEIARLRAALRFAAGYISAQERHKNQHPEDVLRWIEDTARAALNGEEEHRLVRAARQAARIKFGNFAKQEGWDGL